MNSEDKTTDFFGISNTIKAINPLKETTNFKTPENSYDNYSTEQNTKGDEIIYKPTPAQIAQTRRDNSEAQKNDVIRKTISFTKWFLSAAIGFALAIWAIQVANLIKPVAILEEKFNQTEKNISKIEQQLSELKNEISNTREEFIKNGKK